MTSRIDILTIGMARCGGEEVEAAVHDLDPEFFRIIVRRGPTVLEVIESMPAEWLAATIEELERRHGAGG